MNATTLPVTVCIGISAKMPRKSRRQLREHFARRNRVPSPPPRQQSPTQRPQSPTQRPQSPTQRPQSPPLVQQLQNDDAEDQQRFNREDPLSGEIVYEDDSLKATIVNAGFKRQKRFSLTDLNYRVHILPKPSLKNALLNSILNLLRTVIVAALTLIKERVTRKGENGDLSTHEQIYGVVICNSLKRGIPTGNYNLNTAPEVVALTMINYLSR